MFRGMKGRKPRSEGNSDVQSSAKTDRLLTNFSCCTHYGDCECKVKMRSAQFAHGQGDLCWHSLEESLWLSLVSTNVMYFLFV